ncbi:hypothetical protein FRB96_002232 [Tulasnella sp. 330]|nr:hypothetical protein FRB96_002232 [Tulasnella sp. 330]KAG8881712.1 hypothetical protein FRB98_004196 [Tulasnella sp. 332]
MDTTSSSPNLPPEIYIQISQVLGQPSHPSAYCLASGHAHALAQLCSTNHTLYVLAKPILYSRVCITPESLACFTNTVAPALMNTPPLLTDPYLVRGVLVKSLAFAKFDLVTRTQAQQIGSILYALRHTVIRLFLGVPLGPSVSLSPSVSFRPNVSLRRTGHDLIYNALGSLSAIQELCIGYNLHDWRYFPTWKTLKQMAIVMFTLSPQLLTKLSDQESLNLCIMAYPLTLRVMGSNIELQQDISTSLKGNGPGPPELVLAINPTEDAWFVNVLDKRARNQSEGSGEAVVKGNMTVMELPRIGDRLDTSELWRAKREWFARVVLDGSIWIRQRETWKVYCAKHPGAI